MPDSLHFSMTALNAFNKVYETVHEDVAAQTRGAFLRAFPLKSLSAIELDDYVIGLQRPTFCTYVEVKTRPWANIQGATASKFGVYFGKIKGESKQAYRFTKRFGNSCSEAFESVRSALLELVSLGRAKTLDFEAIDANPLSQMFKAKILSLYFPNRFLNVCSSEHLCILAEHFNFIEDRPVSEYQHLLTQVKESNAITVTWSNPKFMAFLYRNYIRVDTPASDVVAKPRKKGHRKVNFDEVLAQRGLIGKAAEEFALDWEHERLEGIGLGHMVGKIDDRRDRPSYGYDFQSHSSSTQERYIEVKSIRKLPKGLGYRFFLSENECSVSRSDDHFEHYYFYMVFFDSDSKPVSLTAIRADELYQACEMSPAVYSVQFELQLPTR
jgi:hypothetical protein